MLLLFAALWGHGWLVVTCFGPLAPLVSAGGPFWQAPQHRGLRPGVNLDHPRTSMQGRMPQSTGQQSRVQNFGWFWWSMSIQSSRRHFSILLPLLQPSCGYSFLWSVRISYEWPYGAPISVVLWHFRTLPSVPMRSVRHFPSGRAELPHRGVLHGPGRGCQTLPRAVDRNGQGMHRSGDRTDRSEKNMKKNPSKTFKNHISNKFCKPHQRSIHADFEVWFAADFLRGSRPLDQLCLVHSRQLRCCCAVEHFPVANVDGGKSSEDGHFEPSLNLFGHFFLRWYLSHSSFFQPTWWARKRSPWQPLLSHS